MAQKSTPYHPPIAVVGLSALFPGSQNGWGFWRDILAGKDQIRDVPETHWRAEDYYSADPKARDRTYCKRGGFLDAYPFDCRRYGLPPNLLESTDSSQLLALCLAEQVLEDTAGGPWKDLDRSRTSVILGATGTSELVVHMGSRLQAPIWMRALEKKGIVGAEAEAIVDEILNHYAPWTEASFPGLLGNVVAGRVANRFDLGGTNCVVDAACASSHSALAMGLSELVTGSSDLVITGGVDTLNDVLMYLCFSKTPALSPTGDCRPFSDRADGTVLGEGLAMVALRRLEDAEAAGDQIYAVIRGIGSSSDGRGTSVYAPLPKGQSKALHRAYDSAGYGPSTVELVEAHGTGTKAGDKAELAGLSMVFDSDGSTENPWCAVGSIKSMIGHTKGAAGAASLFKVVMALHQGVLPPTIKVDRPRPELQDGKLPFYVNTEARPWVRGDDHPRRASVSAFGFGGSNFHATLEEYTGPLGKPRYRITPTEALAFSAATRDGLKATLENLQGLPADATLQHVARDCANAADPNRGIRLALCIENLAELKDVVRELLPQLATLATTARDPQGRWFFGEHQDPGKVAFLFPGQGSQRVGMGADLAMAYKVALSTWDRGRILDSDGGAPDRMVFPPPAFSDEARAAQEDALRATEQAQPALAAASAATLEVLRSLGIAADEYVGHSFGELTALHAVDAIDLETLYRLARQRGLVMKDSGGGIPGGMAAVSATAEQIAPFLAATNGKVIIANRNSPRQQVLAGEAEVLRDVVTRLQNAGLRAVSLPVSTAFHSPLMHGAGDALRKAIKDLRIRAPKQAVFGAREVKPWPGDAKSIHAELGLQLESPVRFQETIEALHGKGVRTFLEVGPGSVLTGLVGRILGDQPHHAIATDRKGRHGVRSLHAALGELWSLGVAIQFPSLWTDIQVEPAPPPAPDGRTIVPVLGINYGKSYPATWSEPIPPVTPPKVPAPQERPAAAPVQPGPTTRPTPMTTPQQPAAPPPQPDPTNAFLALQQLQESTARAHESFLNVARQSLDVMQGLMTGGIPVAPMVAPQQTPAPPPLPIPQMAPAPAPAPVPPAPTPPPAAPIAVTPTPVATPAPAAAPPASHAVSMADQLMEIVAEKTGYPVESIDPTMDLEADLGIDSIKRVEILSAVRERHPALPEPDASQMGAARTLNDVLALLEPGGSAPVAAPTASQAQMNGQTSPPAAAPSAAGSEAQDDIVPVIISIVAEKTGYPEEAIDTQMDLEADLGIDSIKRVEILSAVKERLPHLPEPDPALASAARTLDEVQELLLGKAPAVAPSAQAETTTAVNPKTKPSSPATTPSAETPSLPLVRSVLRWTDCEPTGFQPPWTVSHASVVIIEDQGGIATSLAHKLKKAGFDVSVKAAPSAGDENLILLHGLDAQSDVASYLELPFQSLKHLQQAQGDGSTKPRWIFSAQATGLELPSQGLEGPAWSSGLAALVKVAAAEWPGTVVRTVDVARKGRSAGEIADQLLEEIFQGEGDLEVRLGTMGTRKVASLVTDPVEAPATERMADPIVAIGGARGVTAECLIALARRTKGRVALLGRTTSTEEPAWSRGVDAMQLRAAAARAPEHKGQKPRELERHVKAVLAAREISATVRSLEACGAEVLLLSCDARDPRSFRTAIDTVTSTWETPRTFVHGAGVLADQLLERKDRESWDRVVLTKTQPLQHIIDVAPKGATLLMFGSIAGRSGNAGQSDYAVANATLARVGEALHKTKSLKVRTVDWGPWDGGMVTDGLRRMFLERGIAVIPRPEGAEQGASEILAIGDSEVTEVVFGPAPDKLTLPVTRDLGVAVGLKTHPYLKDHGINGEVVLPLVLVQEWFLRALRCIHPERIVPSLADLAVLRGVVLDSDANQTYLVRIDPQGQNGPTIALIDPRDHSKRFTAQVEDRQFGDRPAPPTPKGSPRKIESRWLFHGPQFQGLKTLKAVSAEGALAELEGIESRRWAGSGWVTDPLAMDCGLQLARIWGFQTLEAPTLPTRVRRVEIHQIGPIRGRVEGSFHGVTRPSGITGDLHFRDQEGRVIARLLGLEMYKSSEAAADSHALRS